VSPAPSNGAFLDPNATPLGVLIDVTQAPWFATTERPVRILGTSDGEETLIGAHSASTECWTIEHEVSGSALRLDRCATSDSGGTRVLWRSVYRLHDVTIFGSEYHEIWSDGCLRATRGELPFRPSREPRADLMGAQCDEGRLLSAEFSARRLGPGSMSREVRDGGRMIVDTFARPATEAREGQAAETYVCQYEVSESRLQGGQCSYDGHVVERWNVEWTDTSCIVRGLMEESGTVIEVSYTLEEGRVMAMAWSVDGEEKARRTFGY
jgi:hypothetical protein